MVLLVNCLPVLILERLGKADYFEDDVSFDGLIVTNLCRLVTELCFYDIEIVTVKYNYICAKKLRNNDKIILLDCRCSQSSRTENEQLCTYALHHILLQQF